MSEIISPRLWNSKPSGGAVINYGHPLAEGILMAHLFNEFGGSFHWDYERGKVLQFINGSGFGSTTLGHSWVPGNDEHGPAVSCGAADAFSLGFAGEAEAAIPTDRVTILVIRRKTDATNNRASALFGLQTSTAALRCGAHAPFSDGNVYWDFGGTGSPNRLTISGVTFNQQLEKWAFVAGGRGSSVWRNSIKLGSQGTAITRTQSAVNSNLLCLNTGNGATSPGDVQEIYFFAAFATEWTDDMVQWWMDEPYAMFVPPSPRAVYIVPAVGAITPSQRIRGCVSM